MKHSGEFYKVVNTVINTLNEGRGVRYMANGVRGSYDASSDVMSVRKELLSYPWGEGVYEDEVDDSFAADNKGCDFFYLERGTKDGHDSLYIAINPDNYVTSSYVLRDMICEEQGLEGAEITTGMNGYPRGLRGCVLLNDCGKTIEQMRELAELYGVELVSLHRRDGWQLWECEGWRWDLYDYAAFMDERNDNLHWWDSYQAYVDELREYADEAEDEELRQKFYDAADEVDGMELGDNEFLYCSEGYPYLTEPDKADRMVDHFSYDTHNFTLALDCVITE